MKLENFDKVRDLIRDRDYHGSLLKIADGNHPKMIIGDTAHNETHLHPTLIARIMPEVAAVIRQQIAVIDEKLLALGVTASQGEV
jgi:hypothetical protein